MTSEPPEEIWFINMIQSRSFVSAVKDRGYELALVDSGSGLVACPVDYAPDVPLLPVSRNVASRSMVNAIGGPVEVYGRKEILNVLDNGESLIDADLLGAHEEGVHRGELLRLRALHRRRVR